MFDTHFYMKVHNLPIIKSNASFYKDDLLNLFEKYRSKEPFVYNIETTNACNMKCEMCPRTTLMTRPVVTMKKELFSSIVNQLRPFHDLEWNRWIRFCELTYGIPENGMSENHFFLYVIPKVIQLHGYGDPLLDKNLPDYIRLLHQKGFYSYFSCNPANINISATEKMFQNGLDYIKYSIESVSDMTHKRIRGTQSDFTQSYDKIIDLLDIKSEQNYQTTIVITMLDLNRPDQKEEYQKLKDAFKGEDVYLYLKSEDTQWYRKDYHGTNSIHWLEFCKHPWMSMTIKSNGEAAMCMEDYNNAIVLGDANKESLVDIWNGKKYQQFRKYHFNPQPGPQCKDKCDMKLIGDCL
jgi:radical SAM protein with 4Fe4S-binding SPASM domain